MMRRYIKPLLILAVVWLGFMSVSHAEIDSITVIPASAVINIDLDVSITRQFRAIAHHSDGPDTDVTAQANWQSSDPVKAEVDVGVARGLSGGLVPVVISAFVEENGVTVSGDAVLAVSEVLALVVTPAVSSPINVDLDDTVTCQFSASALTTSELVLDVTDKVDWISSDTALVTVATDTDIVLATALAPGMPRITASLTKRNGSVLRAVGRVSILGVDTLTVLPSRVSLDLDGVQTQQFTVTATLTDGSEGIAPTKNIAWVSKDDTIAVVNDSGLATVIALGDTDIKAVFTKTDGSQVEEGAYIEAFRTEQWTMEASLEGAIQLGHVSPTSDFSASNGLTLVTAMAAKGITAAGLAVDDYGNIYVSDQGSGGLGTGSILLLPKGAADPIRIIRELNDPGDIELSPDGCTLHVAEASGGIKHCVLGFSVKVTNLEPAELMSKKTTVFVHTDFGERMQRLSADGYFHFLNVLVPGQSSTVDIIIEHDGQSKVFEKVYIGRTSSGGDTVGHGIIHLIF